MSVPSTAYHPLSVTALGWGFSVALIVLFVLCLFAALFVPIPAAHGWVGLFSTAPINSGRVWVEGIAYSAIVGWITASIVGLVYNWFVAPY